MTSAPDSSRVPSGAWTPGESGEDEDDDDGHGSEGHRHDHLGEDVGGRVQWGQRQLPAPAQCAFDRDLGAAGGRGHHRPVGGQ
jgi:hypothetical protein